MLDSLSPPRRRLVLVALALGLLTALAGSLAVTLPRLDAPTAVDQGVPGPVLLVSGYGGSVASLEPLRTHLEGQGRDVVVGPPLGDGTGDLRRQAQALGEAAESALATYHATSVDVVGYSAGGVVARSWVRDHGGAAVARRVFSIGTPQHGTELAAEAAGIFGGCPEACEQLASGSSFLRALNAGDETPDGPRFVSVWSRTDEVVLPPDSARLAGALDLTVQDSCPRARTSHGALPGDPVVLATLDSTLGTALPAPPQPSACG